MNIGLDARTIFSPRPRGTGRNLADAFRLLPELRPDWTFTLYHHRPVEECPLLSGPGALPLRMNVRSRRLNVPGDRYDTWFQVGLPLAARWDGVDLLHLPANAAPAWCPVPYVATIHDLIPLKVAGEATLAEQKRFRTGVLRAVRRAAHVITPSFATRNELCTEFGVDPERISVIPWAPDNAMLAYGAGGLADDAACAVRERYGITRPWLVNFSGGSRRKNATAVLAALARLSPELRGQHQLVLVGCSPEPVRRDLAALAERLGVSDDCRILGFVPHEDLPPLLAGSRALLIPSLCEGFGLPILDAFATGVPVLAAAGGSLEEVAGEAAVYCDPTSPESIAAGLAEVLRAEVSARLVAGGRARVQAFTWERTARAMGEVYSRAVAAAGRSPVAQEVLQCR
ncbi:MAG: glycosyltransferase family 1 protein [Phycisphaerae bacterium]|jgi:alpha-1,3-rhamnosyl/mannosyltransferase